MKVPLRKEVLTRRNFQIPCFKFVNLCCLLVGCLCLLINKYICAGKYGQIFALDKSGGISEKAATIGNTTMQSYSPISLTPSPLIFKQKSSLLLLFYSSFNILVSLSFLLIILSQTEYKRAQTWCQVCHDAMLLTIHLSLSSLTICELFSLLHNIFSAFIQMKWLSWLKISDRSRSVVWKIMRSNGF